MPNIETIFSPALIGHHSLEGRNAVIIDVLRDYGYVDARGMGVRTKIVPLMRRYNQTEPVFELTDDYLKTTLPRF